MSATAIRQAPGWWASLCRAECDDCGWRGPVRDTSTTAGDIAVRGDKQAHRCGRDDYDLAPARDGQDDDDSGGAR